jgi:hypothetical protein
LFEYTLDTSGRVELLGEGGEEGGDHGEARGGGKGKMP